MTSKNVRVLQAVVILLGLTIVVGMGVLGTVLSQRIGSGGSSEADQVWDTQFNAATVLEVRLEGNRAAVRLQTADGIQRIEIIDIRTGAQLGTVIVTP